MTQFETALWAARKTALGAMTFDGILANAFVMRAAVGNAYCVEGISCGDFHRTADVVHVGSLINYGYFETEDGKRFLILSHECAEAERSFAQMRRLIEVNADYFASKRAA